jgi:hypothetical protein
MTSEAMQSILEWLDDRGDPDLREASLAMGKPTMIRLRRLSGDGARECVSGILVGANPPFVCLLRKAKYLTWIHLDTVYSVTQRADRGPMED